LKSILLALLATLVGTAMVAGGVYGLVKGDDDDDSTAATTATTPRVAVPDISPSRDECAEVRDRDPRLAKLDDRRFDRAGGETGTLGADLICNGETIVLSIGMAEVAEKDTTTYFAWLYTSRRRAERVGTLIGSDGRGFGSVTIGPDVDTTKYDSLVITRVPFGQQEERPRKIVFRTPL
jgi:hypothetical protein